MTATVKEVLNNVVKSYLGEKYDGNHRPSNVMLFILSHFPERGLEDLLSVIDMNDLENALPMFFREAINGVEMSWSQITFLFASAACFIKKWKEKKPGIDKDVREIFLQYWEDNEDIEDFIKSVGGWQDFLIRYENMMLKRNQYKTIY
jgi:hypothetical protein